LSCVVQQTTEFPNESICDKCEGCGMFKDENDEERECQQDKEEGECYHRYVDLEQFGQEVENTLDDLFELITVDQIN